MQSPNFRIKIDDWLQSARDVRGKICGGGEGFIVYDEKKPETSMIFFKEEEPNPILVGFVYEVMSRFVECPEVNFYENVSNVVEGDIIIEARRKNDEMCQAPRVLIATKGLSREYCVTERKTKKFHMQYSFSERSTRKGHIGLKPMFNEEERQSLIKESKEVLEKWGYEKLKISFGKIALLQHILRLYDMIECNPQNFGVSIIKKGQKEYIKAAIVDFGCGEKIALEELIKFCNVRLSSITQKDEVVMTQEDMEIAFRKIKFPFQRKKTNEGYYVKDKENKTSFKEVIEVSWKKIMSRIVEMSLSEDKEIQYQIERAKVYRDEILKGYEEFVDFMDS